VQWRGPQAAQAALGVLRFYDPANGYSLWGQVPLAGVRDTGLDMFQTPAQMKGVACAACHPEGGDDGHTWQFQVGDEVHPRRTQSLRGGIMATAPFHWDGDLAGMRNLMTEVFTKRMGGKYVAAQQLPTLQHFLDGIPALPPASNLDTSRVSSGASLFESKGCTSCHSGAHFTNNQNKDVGTGSALQVPQLVNVGYRAPFMHDGCAKTLDARFEPSCGGSTHGPQDLTSAEKLDLTAYLESL
jgi:cytochrome c peroxidase